MESWELDAREQIRDLVARYNAKGDAGRLDEMLELFAPDGELEFEARVYRGRDEIRAMFADAVRSTVERSGGLARHFTATHQIDFVDRERAHGRCYFQVLTESGLDHWGRYVDAYRRVDGRWRFATRRIDLDGRAAEPRSSR